jgi:peptidylprolyl isomerase
MRTVNRFFLILLFSCGAALAHAADLDLENTLYMDLKDGRVVITMRPDLAPETVERIKQLTRAGHYDGSPFHRVLPNFMAQTGSNGKTGAPQSDLQNLPDEFNLDGGRSPRHWRGMVSMANRTDPGTANSQFFIVLLDKPHLDGKYTQWGEVVDGMRYVDRIKEGDEFENDGVVEDPDRIIKMVVAADVEVETPEVASEGLVSQPQ